MNSNTPTASPRSNSRAFARCVRGVTILAALTATTAALPAGAAESAQDPIEIRSCSAVYAPATEQLYAMGMLSVGGVQIDFVNRTGVRAEDVTFQIGSDATATLVADHGSFAPDALIQRVFWLGPGVDTSTCRVAAARFAGGTAYDARSAANTAGR